MDITAEESLDSLLATASLLTPSSAGDDMIQALTTAALTHLLNHELMSAEACRSACAQFEHLPVAGVLREVMAGHHHRAGVLFEAIRANQGHPAVGPAFPEASTQAPATGDARTVLALLLDLEQRGVAAYHQALRQLNDLTRVQVEADLLPAQERALASIAGAQLPPPDGSV